MYLCIIVHLRHNKSGNKASLIGTNQHVDYVILDLDPEIRSGSKTEGFFLILTVILKGSIPNTEKNMCHQTSDISR